MDMRTWFVLLLTSLVFASGCRRAPEPPPRIGGVAVIDLEAVAKRIGRTVVINQELIDAEAQLAAKLEEIQKQLQEDLEKSRKELSEPLSAEDNDRLLRKTQELNEQFQAKQREVQQEFSTLRTNLIKGFREEIQPLAKQVAASRGLDVVLLRNDGVYAVAEAVDITDEVVGIIIAKGKTSVASPSPSSSPAKP